MHVHCRRSQLDPICVSLLCLSGAFAGRGGVTLLVFALVIFFATRVSDQESSTTDTIDQIERSSDVTRCLVLVLLTTFCVSRV